MRRGVIRTLLVLVLLIIAGGLSYFAGGGKFSGDEDVSREVVGREAGRLIEQIKSIRNEVELLTGKSTPDAVWPPEKPATGPASKQDFLNEFNRLRRETVDLAIAVNRLKHNREPGIISHL